MKFILGKIDEWKFFGIFQIFAFISTINNLFFEFSNNKNYPALCIILEINKEFYIQS